MCLRILYGAVFANWYHGSLDYAERLLFMWLNNYPKIQGIASLLSAVSDRDSMMKDPAYPLKDIEDKDTMNATFPSMKSWHALMSMYAGRQAGYHCRQVFQFLEGLENQIAAKEKIVDTQDMVEIHGYKIPANICADERIHKDYIRALCSTESYSDAFRILSQMISEKNMKVDAHVMVALIKIVTKPNIISDAVIPQINDLTIQLIKRLHEWEISDAVNKPMRKDNRSSDSCLVLNTLVAVLCERGKRFISLDALW